MIPQRGRDPPTGYWRLLSTITKRIPTYASYRSQITASPSGQQSGFHTPASPERDFSLATGRRDAGFDTSIDSLPESVDLSNLQRSQNSEKNAAKPQQLSPNEMIAPVSAMHSMSVNLLGSDSVSYIFDLIQDPVR